MSNTIYLYLKTHQTTGLKYLGTTRSADTHKYKGSGKAWIPHIEKHGYAGVVTEILHSCIDDDEMKLVGLEYSKKWDIVNSKEFANLVPESGPARWAMANYKHSEETCAKMRGPKSEAHKAKLRGPRPHARGRGEKRGPMSEERKASMRGPRTHTRGPRPHTRGPRGPMSEEQKAKLRGPRPHTRGPMSEEQKASMRHPNKKKRGPMSEEHKELRRKPQPLVTCPHCNMTGGKGGMARCHFDKCKSLL